MTDHTHSHDENHHHDHPAGWRDRLMELFRPHRHGHRELATDRAFAANQAGIRTVWLALAALAITSVLQLVVVLASGSVALLGDTAHNIGDGLNSLPLLLAFYLARRLPTKRYNYGFGRAEDIAGIFIVLSILVSAGIVLWESVQRLLDPQPLSNLGWVAAAAFIGFLGNEAVAWMQIRTGRRIGSEALVADGLHARTDGLTSLAALVAVGGAWLGYPIVDPLVGLLIGVVILLITWDASKRMWLRLMDAVDPEMVARAERLVGQHPAVQQVERVRLRWVGHQLQGDLQVVLRSEADRPAFAHDIRHALEEELPALTDLTIEAQEP